MPMNPNFLCCIGAELKNSTQQTTRMTQVYLYRAFETQTIADMLSDGFFNEALGILRQDDLLLLYSPNETAAKWCYARVADTTRDGLEIEKIDINASDIIVDTTGFSNISGNNLQELMESIDAEFSKYLKLDGSTTMTGVLKMRASVSFQCAIAPCWDGVGFFKLNSDDSVSLMASMEDPDGLCPATNDTYNIGKSAHKWKNLYLSGKAYMSVINNGYDIAVPVTNSADTLALKSQVDDAANSGEQLYSTGVWYAKMHTETVAPSAENGRNYADFSQVDNDNNPIIVIYERQNGAWVELTRITPPANHNGYITVTSKIWDISEQAGQQGGQILWSYNSKTFTPYPKIISFESINITGNSTVTMSATPTDDSIPNKKYVDDAVAGAHYHPELLSHEWDDHERSDMNWVNALTFSWQNRADHQVAYDELASNISGKTLQSETVAGTTVQFYLADNGRKICPATQESNVAAIYAATGVAWYYIIDTTNQRFKLPRSLHNKYASSLAVGGTGKTLGLTNGVGYYGFAKPGDGGVVMRENAYDVPVSTSGSSSNSPATGSMMGVTTDFEKSGIIALQEQDTDQYKYLYFYVGGYTQSAVENTAGLNAELFNNKVDIGHDVIAFQAPTAQNNYTWYRLYRDGWVEQGGRVDGSSSDAVINFPITMADSGYYINGHTYGNTDQNVNWIKFGTLTTTGTTYVTGYGSNNRYGLPAVWEVKGKAA